MKQDKIIRCINKDTNQVKFFPESICMNTWWQKNTRFIPQPIEEIKPIVIESPIINSNNNELSDVASVKTTEENTDVTFDDSKKTKRKYTKRKSS